MPPTPPIPEGDIQRWTAKRTAAAVLDLITGHGHRYGCGPAARADLGGNPGAQPESQRPRSRLKAYRALARHRGLN